MSAPVGDFSSTMSARGGLLAARSSNLPIRILGFLLILGIGLVFQAMIPPFQSPDEFDHVQRAYLLSKGQILLDTPADTASGGHIDKNLVAYIETFKRLRFNPDRKISQQEIDSSHDLPWSGERVFVPLPGTGYYFPLAYAPQAVALFAGERAGLSVDATYRLARFLTLSASLLVIAFAFTIVPANAFVLALLVLPMSVFQLVSPSLDAFTTATALLCISLFLRGADASRPFPHWMSHGLLACILLLVTSRIHLMPLLALPLALYWIRRERLLIWQFLAASLLAVTWSVVAITSTHDPRAGVVLPKSEVLAYYLSNPAAVVRAVLDTFDIPGRVLYYRDTLIGVLGWLDTRFSPAFYSAASILLGLAFLSALSVGRLQQDWRPRAVLLLVAIGSVVLTFLALLVAWNTVPAKVIEGIQGRYFLVPLIILGYALSGASRVNRWSRAFGVGVVTLLAAMSLIQTPQLLIERYFVQARPAEEISYQRKPSQRLAPGAPILLHLIPEHAQHAAGLKRIGIMFGTYRRANPGDAELQLIEQGSGKAVTQRFSLPELADNRYRFFDLDGGRYTGGSIIAVSGLGVSTWESHGAGVRTCIVYVYATGAERFTPGCPRP